MLNPFFALSVSSINYKQPLPHPKGGIDNVKTRIPLSRTLLRARTLVPNERQGSTDLGLTFLSPAPHEATHAEDKSTNGRVVGWCDAAIKRSPSLSRAGKKYAGGGMGATTVPTQ